MSVVLSLLRSGGTASTGIERFVEHLEERCLLSAALPHHKLIPIDYYAGAGTTVNAFSPNTALTVTSAAPNALPLPAAPLSLAALAPSTNILPGTTPGGVSNVDLIVNNSVSAAPLPQGQASSLFADQGIGSIFSALSATVAPEFQLSSGSMSILSAGQLSGGGLISVFAGQ